MFRNELRKTDISTRKFKPRSLIEVPLTVSYHCRPRPPSGDVDVVDADYRN